MSEAELRNGIEYILFVEHEVPMEYFTKLETVVDDLVQLSQAHTKNEVEATLRQVKYNIANRLKQEVGDIVCEALPKDEPVVVPTEVVGW